jgi:O-antigen/teichoic acid export membrane protein
MSDSNREVTKSELLGAALGVAFVLVLILSVNLGVTWLARTSIAIFGLAVFSFFVWLTIGQIKQAKQENRSPFIFSVFTTIAMGALITFVWYDFFSSYILGQT